MSDSLRKRAAKILAPLVLGAMAVAGAPAQADEAPTTAPVTGSANRPVHAAGASCGADLTEADLTEAARYGGVERDASLSAARVRSYEHDLARRLGVPKRTSARALRHVARQRSAANKRITVPVRAHVIKPHRGEAVLSRAKVRRQVRIMNNAYRGRQARNAYNTGIRFRLKSTDYTVNRSYYHASLETRASKRMRKKLHRGGRGTLNLYFSSPRGYYGKILGYSTFPQRVRKHPEQDGVVVNVSTLKKHGLKHYRSGDTAVHEVGHWLGLYHTFQGGCGKQNDRVTDTARESGPNFRCPGGLDTCKAPGRDPIHNFMDYSYDHCMKMFTKGQSERMKLHWMAYRD